MEDAAVLQPRRVHRYAIPDRDTFDRLAVAAPPAGLRAERSEFSFFRDVYLDTRGGDLERRGASVRVRLQQDGDAKLYVDVQENTPDGTTQRRRLVEAAVDADALAALRDGRSESARLIRGLIDPTQLTKVLELETLRRERYARGEAGELVRIVLDLVTVRSGGFSGELLELELAVPSSPAAAAAELLRAWQEQYGLKPMHTDVRSRARALFDRFERVGMERELHAAREVAVIVHDRGALALLQQDGDLRVPTCPGGGARSCRTALREVFGRGSARLRLLGVRGDIPGMPAVEVWLAEDVVAGHEVANLVWLPITEALDRAGAPRLRDARTLAALQVVARSSFGAWAPPVSVNGVRSAGPRGREPFELVLQRLEAGDTAYEVPATDVPPELLLNMELARLAFDERVLLLAEDATLPLLERLRFVAMFGERRDDFFMTRVAHFKRMLARGDASLSMDGLTAAEQLDAIAARARQITRRAYELLNERLLPELQAHGIRIDRWEALAETDRAFVRERYGAQIEALITPLATDPAHPFPHVRNLRPALVAAIRAEGGNEQSIAIELPGELPRFVALPGGGRFVMLEDVIEASLPELYPGYEVVRAHTFRVTRSAHMDLGGEPLDLLQMIEEEVTRRPFQEVVRLEVEHAMPPYLRHQLLREFQYEQEDQLSTPGEQDVYTVGRLVDLAALKQIAALDRPELRFTPVEQRAPFDAERSVFSQVAEQEQLVQFPRDDFERSVSRFLREAAEDDAVVSIKVTLYRTGKGSQVVAALRQARARGKEVTALLELKASFDEQRNIEWARELEQDGIRVVFSPVRFKVHAKIALIVRREDGTLRRYAYIGTGNLNEVTARSYVDLGLFTAAADLTREVGAVFNLLTGYSSGTELKHLLIAPFDMRRRFLRLIEREASHALAGLPAGIRVQLNGLADRRLIGALYRAAQAGVRVEMIVREICTLRPGVPGVSDNITVVSLVGRELQHARIFHFRNAGEDEYYIGSADWRPRNLRERVEVVTPVREAAHHAQLDALLSAGLENPQAWRLQPDGKFVRR